MAETLCERVKIGVMVEPSALVQELGRARRAVRARLGLRAGVVMALGPLVVLAGLAWVVAQPYRLTLLHPRSQPLWWLLVEPQLLVIGAGLLFAVLVAPGLLDDLERAEED
jgi:hypothetical protein